MEYPYLLQVGSLSEDAGDYGGSPGGLFSGFSQQQRAGVCGLRPK